MKKFYLALMGLLLSSNFISDVNARGGRNKSKKNPDQKAEDKNQDQSVTLLSNTSKEFINSNEGKEIMVKYIQKYPSSLLKVLAEEASKTNDDKLKELVRNLEKEGIAKDVEATSPSTTPTNPAAAAA
jgi:hypothetical protein